MKIIGCDFHPSYQQIAMVDTETGELWEGRLEHAQGEAQRFYHAPQGQPVRVGMEAVGNAQWFERMLASLGQELWIGDAAQIRQVVVRRRFRLVSTHLKLKLSLRSEDREWPRKRPMNSVNPSRVRHVFSSRSRCSSGARKQPCKEQALSFQTLIVLLPACS